MKLLSRIRRALLLVLGLIFMGCRIYAQGSFVLSVTSSASSVLVSNSVTYNISVTNFTGFPAPNVVVTNALPDSAIIQGTSTSQGTITTNGGVTVFNLGPAETAQMSVTVQLTATGLITNTVTVSSINVTNTALTNVVVQVTNIPPTETDLGVTINGPVQTIITNDLIAYDLIVTNAGPSTATGVLLTNALPPGIILKGASQSYTRSGTNMIFSLGTLTNGSQVDVQISIQPTNAGLLPLAAAVGTPNLLDSNPANNFASTNFTVTSYLPGTLIAVTNSPQITNPQNGLKEQSVLLTNTGTNDVPAVRLVVTGLSNQLFNAVGTNNGSPFVIYSTALAAGQSIPLLLQYFPRNSFPFTNSQLHAFAVPVPDWTPPTPAATSAGINISRIVQLANGNMLIEWPTISNRSYTVVYSDNILFSNAMIAPPAIVAPANRVQWTDYGPPTTVSATTNAGTRFYRVFEN
jgi:uncharacterized repeat protein (TIGR01451 family)